MAETLVVSAPCDCGSEVAPFDAVCLNCEAQVSPMLGDELRTRLAASHPEYASAQLKIFFGRVLILVGNIVHLGLLFLFTQWRLVYFNIPLLVYGFTLLMYAVYGLLVAGFFVLSRRAPIRAFAAWILFMIGDRAIVFTRLHGGSRDTNLWIEGIATAIPIVASGLFLGLIPALRARQIMRRFARTRR